MKAGRAPAKGSFMENQTARFVASVSFRLCSALCHDLKTQKKSAVSSRDALWDLGLGVAGAATGAFARFKQRGHSGARV